jgi:FkbM family methyltransferase
MSDLNLNWVLENFGDKNMNLFDIGAATLGGDAAMFKRSLPKANIYAFECADIWKDINIKEAKLLEINYYHVAMSDKNEKITFYPSAMYKGEQWPYSGSVCKPKMTETSHEDFVWGEPQTVESIRIDTFCDTNNITPDFIHIDVQGAEYKVLSSLGRYRPWAIWTEVNEFENCYETDITHAAFIQLLNNFGYTKLYSNNVDELYVLTDLSITPYYEKQKWQY